MNPINILFLLITVLIISIALFVTFYYPIMIAKKRNQNFEDFAKVNNLKVNFNLKSDDFINKYEIALLSEGIFKKIERIVEGNLNGKHIVLFDYKYTPLIGTKKGAIRQTMLIVQINSEVPKFKITPENILDKIMNAVGFKDINFDSHKNFSEMFKLTGENEKQVREIFNQNLLSYFENLRNFSFESGKNVIVGYKKDNLVKTEELAQFINSISKISDYV